MKVHGFLIALIAYFVGAAILPGTGTSVLAVSERPKLFVTASGSDTGNGTEAAPFATVSKALAVVPDNSDIYVADGTYPRLTDSRDHIGVTVIGSDNAWVQGAGLTGASGLTFDGINFSATFNMEDKGLSNPTAGITIKRAEIATAYAGACVRIINKSNNIRIENSHLHTCNFGVQGPGRVSTDYTSSSITIQDNTIEDIREDGIQFGFWDNVKILRNTIRNAGVGTPQTDKHPDAIQVTGQANDIEISDNRLGPARSQALMVQSDIGPITGFKVYRNRIGPSYAVAFRLLGVSKAEVRNNVSCGRLGGLWVEPHSKNPVIKDTEITDNVFRGEDVPLSQVLRIYNGAEASINSGNTKVVGKCSDIGINWVETTPSAHPATPTATPSVTPEPLKGDLNSDNKVNVVDLSLLLADWGKRGTLHDLNGDGVVNVIDLSVLLGSWTQ